ncbi:hypothetical protein CAL14_18910 [Bordetella genomosp. 9]|nr:hypothetical protein CAL14_18910 [Bordetella genomosp. 9]
MMGRSCRPRRRAYLPAPVAGTDSDGWAEFPDRVELDELLPEWLLSERLLFMLPLCWEPWPLVPLLWVAVPLPVLDCGVTVELGAGEAVPGGTLALLGGVAVVSFGVVEGVVGADDCAVATPVANTAANARAGVRRRSFMCCSLGS